MSKYRLKRGKLGEVAVKATEKMENNANGEIEPCAFVYDSDSNIREI